MSKASRRKKACWHAVPGFAWIPAHNSVFDNPECPLSVHMHPLEGLSNSVGVFYANPLLEKHSLLLRSFFGKEIALLVCTVCNSFNMGDRLLMCD